MDAIVTAGGIPEPGDPLYEYTQGQPKALLDICDKPMIQWVLDALDNAPTIERVVMIGLEPDSGVFCQKLAVSIPTQGEMLSNIRAGINKVLEINPQAHHVISVSSDVPAITPEMVDWTVNAAMETDDDVYYNLVTREVMEARFPNSRRSFTHLKDVEVCGGDIHVIRTMTVTSNEELWERIIAARKNVFKQASLIGYDTLILLLLRIITLEQGVAIASRRLKVKGRAIISPYAEIGMDVDKPHQLEIIRADMARRVKA